MSASSDRGTGRTTTTLRDALNAARDGYYAVFVVPAHHHIWYVREILMSLATEEERSTKTFLHRGVCAGVLVCLMTDDPYRLRGRDHISLHIDHSVIEVGSAADFIRIREMEEIARWSNRNPKRG